MSKKKTLICIDCQYDFIDGKLKTRESNYAIESICKYVILNHEDIDKIIFTLDWHTLNHCSFGSNGGQWPSHCVQYSKGAAISNDILSLVELYKISYEIFLKGNVDDIEEYGAFDKIGTYGEDDGTLDIAVNNKADNSMCKIETEDVIVCGIAGDYCVKETVKNLMRYDGPVYLNIEILRDGVASIDDGTAFDNFIKENKLKTI